MSSLAALRRARLEARREYASGSLTRSEYQARVKRVLYAINTELMRQAGASEEQRRLLLGPAPPGLPTKAREEEVPDYYSMRLSRLR